MLETWFFTVRSATPSAVPKFENTPLQVALLTSSRGAAKLLLSHGAQVNATQAEGITALHEAASSGDVVLVRMLLAAGADPLAKSSFGTPLELAVKNRHEEAAKLLRR
jgi:ankyrin repeat protein